MATTKHETGNRGLALLGNASIQASIDAIIEALKSEQSTITEARGPTEADRVEFESLLARGAAVRGKGAFFPYLGIGLGNGALVQLADGSVKWDMINGIGVHMFGHSHPSIIRAAVEAGLSDLVMQGNLQANPDSIEIAELLIEEAARGSAIRHCFLTNSGTMANESALKICQQKTNAAPRVIAFQDCFMGRSTTMAQIGDSAGGRNGIPLNMQVDYMPFYDELDPDGSLARTMDRFEEVIRRYPKQHACFIFELIQGEGGFRVAPREFFVALMGRCRDAGIPVWCDEVQSFGRTDSMFRFNGLDIGEYVDVVTVGKMSQVCAALYTEAFNPKAGLLSGTFISSTSALHVGLAALRILRDGGYYGADGRINQLHAAYREHASQFIAAHPKFFSPVVDGHGRTTNNYIGGTGGMMRLTPFGGDRERVVRAMHTLYKEGVISFICGHDPYHLRFLAPIGAMKPDQFEPVFEIMARAFAISEAEGGAS